MTKKTEAAVVRAAMRWMRSTGKYYTDNARARELWPHTMQLATACRAHAKATKGKK